MSTRTEANLTVSVGPDTWPALTQLAAELGYRQRHGKTAGQGSVSALIRALADTAQTQGVRKTAHRLTWIRKGAAGRPPDRDRSDHRLVIGDSLPALHKLAQQLGLVAARSTTVGQGSISAFLETLAAVARQDPEASARRLKWLVD